MRFWVVKFNAKSITNTSRFRKNNNPYLFLNNKLSIGVKPTKDSMDFDFYKLNTTKTHKSTLTSNMFNDLNKVLTKKDKYMRTNKFNTKLNLFNLDLLGKEFLFNFYIKSTKLNTRIITNKLNFYQSNIKDSQVQKNNTITLKKLIWYSNNKHTRLNFKTHFSKKFTHQLEYLLTKNSRYEIKNHEKLIDESLPTFLKKSVLVNSIRFAIKFIKHPTHFINTNLSSIKFVKQLLTRKIKSHKFFIK